MGAAEKDQEEGKEFHSMGGKEQRGKKIKIVWSRSEKWHTKSLQYVVKSQVYADLGSTALNVLPKTGSDMFKYNNNNNVFPLHYFLMLLLSFIFAKHFELPCV